MKKILLLFAVLTASFVLSACDANGNIDQNQLSAVLDNSMSISELSTYDGTDGMPVYIAVNGVIYDVTIQFPDGTHQGMQIGGKDVTLIFENSPHMTEMLINLTAVGRLDAQNETSTDPQVTTEELPVFTLDDLSTYTGANGSTAYIAVNGVIYDVTQAFVNGTHQGMQLGGTDATAAFGASPHSQALLETLPVVGSLEGFPVITTTVETTEPTDPTTPTGETLPVFTLEELAQYTGQNGTKAYLAVSGVVYDGSGEFYNGMHQGFQLGGTDATTIFAASPHATSILKELPIVGSLEGFPLITVTDANAHYNDDHDDDDDDMYIPASDLPQTVLDYIEANYPTTPIAKVEIDDGRYEVELVNELELYFDLSGNFLYSEYDDAYDDDDDDAYDDDDDDMYIPESDLPQVILDYIQTNHPATPIAKVEIDDGRYEVELANELELYFDLSGNFLYSEYDD